MTVGHYLVESAGYLTELDRVKLSGRMSGHNSAISWASGALAIITGNFLFLHFFYKYFIYVNLTKIKNN